MGSKATKGGEYEAIWPGLEAEVPKPLMPYSPAIRAGGWVFIAGTIASDFKTGLAPAVKDAFRAIHSLPRNWNCRHATCCGISQMPSLLQTAA
jgi:enamine deaminase RidA (YjgF/YER057c/UK114 family)